MSPELNRIYLGDNIASMKEWPDACVQTCVTSPPYYALRDYNVAGQIGLEATPEAYVARLVDVFREVRRVLRDDGTLWINLGDSYCASGGHTTQGGSSVRLNRSNVAEQMKMKGVRPTGDVKNKDLLGIPWMVAFALRADGWYLRKDIIWWKKNCMPESVVDRPTSAHEYIFLLSKMDRYYYDADAIKEQVTDSSLARVAQNDGHPVLNTDRKRGSTQGEQTLEIAKMVPTDGLRNKRSVWHIATQPFREAHFATFPPDLITPCVLAGAPRGGGRPGSFHGRGDHSARRRYARAPVHRMRAQPGVQGDRRQAHRKRSRTRKNAVTVI